MVWILRAPWTEFLASVALAASAVVSFFAALHTLGGDGVRGVGSLGEALAYSAYVAATLGLDAERATTPFARVLVGLEGALALLGFGAFVSLTAARLTWVPRR
jgi:hypothetical protein